MCQVQNVKRSHSTPNIKKYLQARMFKYLFLFLFSSANDSEFDSDDGGDIRFISCKLAKINTFTHMHNNCTDVE